VIEGPWKLAGRGAAWLAELIQADGSPRGGGDLRACYKTAIALQLSGHPRLARAVLGHVEHRYLLPGGDLDGAGVPWLQTYRTYPHAWLCCAAVMAARFDLARELSGFIASYHDPSTGGFFADEARTTQEIMTTSMAGLACLWSGRHELATATGGWLDRLYAAQPDLTRGLYTSWSATGLVTRFEEPDAAGCFVNAAKPGQWYFQYGISAAFLAALAGATGESHWLGLARSFLAASEHCGPDRHATPQSGKLGWGAAWAGRRDLAESVALGLGALQNGDGSWNVSANIIETIDVTAEFVALLAFMELA